MLYECHITVDVKDASSARDVATNMHWKTSEIARDPVLGDKNFFYLTTHTNDFPKMWEKMTIASKCLKEMGVKVIREKIELIIHDTKVKV